MASNNVILYPKRLDEVMKLRNVTSVALANQCNVSASTITRVRADKSPCNTNLLFTISEALDVDVKYLTGEINNLKNRINDSNYSKWNSFYHLNKKEIDAINIDEYLNILLKIIKLKNKEE